VPGWWKNGSNARAVIVGGIPQPLSVTSTRTMPSPAGGQLQGAFAAHRLNGVADEVGPLTRVRVLLRARLVPDRAGADTTVIAHIPLSQLRQMPGAKDLEDAWIRARTGEDGYLTGKDAETAACDAPVVPVVTGTMNPDVIDQMINLARTAAEATASDLTGVQGMPGQQGATGPDGPWSPVANAEFPVDFNPAYAPGPSPMGHKADPARANTDPALGRGSPRSVTLSLEAWRSLRYAMARLAIDLVSGPAGVAAILRTGLLDKPYNTPSLPLDIGYSKSIPPAIRRAVLLRDRGCAWPQCDRPAAHCDIHHLRHQQHGGETSVQNCALLCQFHHDVCIHRKGWHLTLYPDGTTQARSPDGSHTLHSHAPPTPQAA
jgi:hypothetical protein